MGRDGTWKWRRRYHTPLTRVREAISPIKRGFESPSYTCRNEIVHVILPSRYTIASPTRLTQLSAMLAKKDPPEDHEEGFYVIVTFFVFILCHRHPDSACVNKHREENRSRWHDFSPNTKPTTGLVLQQSHGELNEIRPSNRKDQK